jgi:predicted transcriptional regulator
MQTLIENNATRILTLLRNEPGQSREDVAAKLLIKPRTLATKVAEMKRNGVVDERGGLLYTIPTLQESDLIDRLEGGDEFVPDPMFNQKKRGIGWLGFGAICVVGGIAGYLLGRYL